MPGVIPEKLRGVHDHILGLRNKRFAHNDEHDSVSNSIEVELHNNRFEIKFGLLLGYQIGGAKEWPELVKFVDELMSARIDKLLSKLKEKTGREWTLPSGPAPE
jgi:hypothetical protein